MIGHLSAARIERGRRQPSVLVGALLMATVGCATVPKEAVELSTTVGRDLAAVHSSYRYLAETHFDHLLGHVDQFVDEVYRPFVIRETLDDLNLMDSLRVAIAGESELDPLDLLEIYADETIQQIDEFRGEMRAPFEAQRAEVLRSIDSAFQQLQNASAIVTGHLASIRKVHDAQNELLDRAGLDDLREHLSQDLAAISDRTGELLEDARQAEGTLDELPAKLKGVVDEIRHK